MCISLLPLPLLLLSLACFKSDILMHAKARGKRLMKNLSEVDVNFFCALQHYYLACKMY